jgi:Tfp pilus assembly protein PilN
MSVRVNLLPQETSARQAAARQRVALVAAGVVILAGLGATTVWQNGRIADANDRLTDEQAVLSALEAEQAQLREFADLEERLAESDTMIAQALGREVSFAGVLQDVASVIPADAQLESLQINVDPVTPDADGEVSSLGTLVAVGRSLNDHAPGLERLLLELDKVVAFHDLFFSSSVLDDPELPYPTFTVEAQLGPEILTGRYADGIPEGLR